MAFSVVDLLARYPEDVQLVNTEIRWCGKCEDHPAHLWVPEDHRDPKLLCLGGWDGRKVKL